MKIVGIIGSTRIGRRTPRVAYFLRDMIAQIPAVSIDMIDLLDANLPFLPERLNRLDDPPQPVAGFGRTIGAADRLLVVSPEYNGGPPGVLKNALDFLNDEYENKPVAIATVSAGPHGGKKCFEALATLFQRLDAHPCDAHLQVTRVDETFDEHGTCLDPQIEAAARRFVDELLGR